MKSFKLILFSLFIVASCSDDNSLKIVHQGIVPDSYNGPLTRILEDNLHSIKQNSTIKLSESSFKYSQTYGYSRVFKHLNVNGYSHDRITRGLITPELLNEYDILFINLVDDEQKDFKVSERAAICDFVFSGGSLFMITDHTNVYNHAKRVNPILSMLGMKARYETAVDNVPHVIEGLAWIKVSDFKEHPVTTEVQEIELLTGGTLDGDGGVAFISPLGWGDYWNPFNPEKPVGKYGNWILDSNEDSGPLSVVQANTYGSGRVVVVGDQNIFGDPNLYFLDNYKLIFNSMEWLGKREDEEPPLRDRKPEGLIIKIDGKSSDNNMSKTFRRTVDRYPFYMNLNRNSDVTAFSSTYPLSYTPHVLMVVEPEFTVDSSTVNEAQAVLDNGGQIVIIFDPSINSPQVLTFMEYWNLDWELSDKNSVSIDISELYTVEPVESVSVNLENRGKIVELKNISGIKCTNNSMLAGMDLMGNSIDLFCKYEKSNGKIILVFTGKNFTQETLGDILSRPEGEQLNNYRLERELVELLLKH
jgi:hypothetical protein